ncbi:MAG TPA: FAD-binding oxidoreductase, partial [Pyrinomonadaceae bacterium]|nr:FAD-binding oxidoreductase [Pyrinomonadaceae bacterium]
QQLSEPGAVATGPLKSNGDKSGLPAPVDTRARTSPNLRVAERLNEVRVLNELKRIVGAANVKKLFDNDAIAKTEFASDNQGALVVTPEAASDVSEVLEFARHEGLSTVPAGNLSWIDVGNRVAEVDLILSTRRMAQMIRHEPADLVATAEAGITLTEFQKQLAERGQWLPVDPPDDGTATLGGIVATGLSGPLTAGFGALRSFVIGLRAVRADGRSIKAGGQVVKNVAGYDLCKLFTGSCGGLAVITEITFKLRPLPGESRTILASGKRDSVIQSGRLIANQFSPVAVEVLSSGLAAQLANAAKPGGFGLLVRFAGSTRAVVTQTAQVLKLLRDAGLHCETFDDDLPLWRAVSSAGSEAARDISWRVTVRPADLPTLAADVAELEEDEASHVQLQWHAGLSDGRLRASAQAPVYPGETARALERLRQRAENLGGKLVIERAPIEIKNEIDSWGSFGSATGLMQRVKAQLDPEDSLSPGRFFA